MAQGILRETKRGRPAAGPSRSPQPNPSDKLEQSAKDSVQKNTCTGRNRARSILTITDAQVITEMNDPGQFGDAHGNLIDSITAWSCPLQGHDTLVHSRLDIL